MPTPYESARLNLQLFDLRREPVLREARAWFLSIFNPDSFAELAALAGGTRNASFRMVLGYWEPDFCRHLEAVVLAAPDAESIMARRRAASMAAARARDTTSAP